jgi:hypothetical protein
MPMTGKGCKAELRLSAQNLRACWGARVCGFCRPTCVRVFGRVGLVGRGPMSAPIAVLKCLGCVSARPARISVHAGGARVCGYRRPIITFTRACLLEGWGWLDAGPCLRLLKCLGCVLLFSSGKIGLRVRKASVNLRACRGARVCGFCRPYNCYACVSFGRVGLVGRWHMSATIAVLKFLGCVLVFWEGWAAGPQSHREFACMPGGAASAATAAL